MMRYDEGWRGRAAQGWERDGGYDRGQAARDSYTPRGQPHPGLWRGAEPEWDEAVLNGPARYGLGPYHRRLQQRRRPDDELRHEVEEALFYDTWVDAEAIQVEVSDGVVTLRGDLPDHAEVRFATDDAWDVEGVRGVRSELRVDARRGKPLDHAGRR
jgi:hypothetical protein